MVEALNLPQEKLDIKYLKIYKNKEGADVNHVFIFLGGVKSVQRGYQKGPG